MPFSTTPALGSLIGFAVGLCVLWLGHSWRRLAGPRLVGGAAGLITGLAAGLLAIITFERAWRGMDIATLSFWSIALVLSFAYLGVSRGAALGDQWAVGGVAGRGSGRPKLLDTSVLIDGRIASVAEVGFLDGPLVVPQFVLRELQGIADSADPLRRVRGRRGLDILQKLQQMSFLTVQLVDDEIPQQKEVDLKLVELAKMTGAKIVTNDFNLNKVAQVHKVDVLNVNDLAQGLRPVVLPGESMQVSILKEGKEHNQGIAYLDDGTMVVVDNGRKLIGKTLPITVTSVIQTSAGKMIFGRAD